MAALNFPSSPTNGQKWVDPNGQSWVYETTTNSWTAEGAPAPGMVYKGGVDITAAPPAGVQAGWVYTVNVGGAVNPGFTGLTGSLAVGAQIIYDGANWQEQGADLWTRTGTTVSPSTAGDDVKTTGNVGANDGTFTGNVQATSFNGGQLAGFRNLLINGSLAINQRGVTIAAAAIGAYGPDRWKKVDAGNMTQIVEAGSFVPGAQYTLSGTGVTTQQLTAPATGNWTIPNIPITATNIQLEPGPVATPFELRPVGIELELCQRYFCNLVNLIAFASAGSALNIHGDFPVEMRAAPTLDKVTATTGLLLGLTGNDINNATLHHPNQVLTTTGGAARIRYTSLTGLNVGHAYAMRLSTYGFDAEL